MSTIRDVCVFMDRRFLVVVVLTPTCLSRKCVGQWYEYFNNNVRLPKEAAETFGPLTFIISLEVS